MARKDMTLPFRPTKVLGAAYGKRPLPPPTPSPRNRFPVHYSMDKPTGHAAQDAAWRGTASARVLDSLKQVEQYGDVHSARVAKLQVRLRPHVLPSHPRTERAGLSDSRSLSVCVTRGARRRNLRKRIRCTATPSASTCSHHG